MQAGFNGSLYVSYQTDEMNIDGRRVSYVKMTRRRSQQSVLIRAILGRIMHRTTKYQTYQNNMPRVSTLIMQEDFVLSTLGFRRGLRKDSFFAADSIDCAALNNSFSAM